MYIAIMGYGTVGSGVAEVIMNNQANIAKTAGQESIDIKYILDLRDFPGDVNEKLMIKDFSKILEDDDIKVVVETMGGLHPAFEFVSSCLQKGKSVVTSNKELVAAKGDILIKLAEENNVNFLFEASVGGGIPVLRPIGQCLAANRITEVAGILNGTTNFILTMMIDKNMSFEDALKLAQDNGYAEKDPTADIEGHDAGRKICILSSLCFGKHVFPEDIYMQGITKVSLTDVEYAKAWGGVIKLIGRAKKLSDDKISALVSPAFVKNGSQLASTNDVFNAILVRGDAVGDVVFYGRGAGKLPTASAVVADVIDCAQHLEKRKDYGWESGTTGYVVDYNEIETAMFIRAKADNKDAAKECIDSAFEGAQFIEKESADENEIAFVTPVLKECKIEEVLSSLGSIDILSKIRIVDY
ncbi:MAG: homoserine dehydrogenase [Clostridia bacterium]|nr:homoserine dehydrogenase [Clostridia bacterium]